MEVSKKFESVRHGDKEGSGLSEKGREQAREKAKSYYREIQESEPGTVFYLIPSIVERAVETRNLIEEELRQQAQGNSEIEFISVQDLERIKQSQGDITKKYVITELQPSTPIGFKDSTEYMPAWNRHAKLFNKEEYYIVSSWIARKSEMQELEADVSGKYPEAVGKVKPDEFGMTPEEQAIKTLRLAARLGQLTEKYFLGHDYRCIQVGHSGLSDISMLPTLGQEINYTNYKRISGEQGRRPLESSHFRSDNGKILARYRENEAVVEKNLDEIIKDLEKASEERKKEWRQPI